MKRPHPTLLLPALLFAAFVAVLAAGEVARSSADANWPAAVRERRAELDLRVREAFDRFQEDGAKAVREAALDILNLPTTPEDPARRRDLFALLARSGGSSLTLEYFDAENRLLAWNGPAGAGTEPGDLDGRHRSFLEEGPIRSSLVIVNPVLRGGRLIGHVVCRRLLSVSAPPGFPGAATPEDAGSFHFKLESIAGPGAGFRIPASGKRSVPSLTAGDRGATAQDPDAASSGIGSSPPRPSDGPVVIPLRGIGGGEIGYAVAPAPDREAWIARTGAGFALWWKSLLVAFFVTATAAAAWRYRRLAGSPGYTAGVLAGLWAGRYLMVFLGIPAGSDPDDLFGPGLFASSFGYGAARSLGDLALSSALLAATLGAAFGVFAGRIAAPDRTMTAADPAGTAPGRRGVRAAIAPSLLFAVTLLLLGPLSRGVYAVIRSVVFDSRVDLTAPRMVYPDVPSGALLLSALLLVFASVVGGMFFVSLARRAAGGLLPGAGERSRWILVAAGAAAGSLLFDLLHPNPLGTPIERLLLTGLVVALAAAAWRRRTSRPAGSLPGSLLLAGLLSAAVLVPVLDRRVHDHDKTLIEAAVRDLARPEDAWMSHLLDLALTSLSDPSHAALLRSSDPRAVAKLAYAAWAGSILPAEGNTCAITYVDLEGSVVSHFHVGPAPHWSREVPMDAMPRSTRMTSRETRTLGGRPGPWYRGYAPVFDGDSLFAGGVWAGLAPVDPVKVLRREEDPLAGPRKYDGVTPARKILLGEYVEGRLISASGDDLPHGRGLPPGVESEEFRAGGVWVAEEIGGEGFETYYYPAPSGAVIAVSLESLDTGWHFYSFSRYALFYGSLFLFAAGLSAFGGLRRAIRERRVSFRAKLIAAFAVVSVIPVLVLASYNRRSLQEEARGTTDEYLRTQTDLVLNELRDRMGMPVPYELARFSDETLEEIGAALDLEAHLFDGPWASASSRPDLFAAELLDQRIPAPVYEALWLSGWNFATAERTLPAASHLVGYRAIRAPSGEVIGAVAVPSLSRQGEMEIDIARRDTILFGIYLLVLAAALAAGAGLASQISRPVRRLTLAARQVATGNLDVALRTDGRDEIGELESAFQGMTGDLKRIQERMVRVERELAWKEMAKQVAHEIKNPLTPMRLSIQHLVSAYRKGGEGFGDLLRSVSATILEQIDALSRIATEFSSFGRMPERRVEPCDLHETIHEAISLFHREGVRFATSFIPGAPTVEADREELRRAFINIFRNSVQAADAEVSIGVSTRMEGGGLAVAVTDDGPGMTPEVLSRLFEPNFSTKTDGMGIGLTLVRKTIEDLGGSIAVESAPGAGTTVRILLPVRGAHEG